MDLLMGVALGVLSGSLAALLIAFTLAVTFMFVFLDGWSSGVIYNLMLFTPFVISLATVPVGVVLGIVSANARRAIRLKEEGPMVEFP